MTIKTASQDNHLPFLDGLRGLAAFWVLVSHAAVLNAVYWPIVSEGAYAVDLFMMLSGFLMSYHYLLRREREPWAERKTWVSFWVRRFFRIAPLFYALLLAAIVLGPWIGEWRDQIASVWPSTATEPARYLDQSATNIGLHLTFLFGLLPDYAFRTALPDWSIGLEMQFYALFPILMLLIPRIGPFGMAAAALVAAVVLRLVLPDYFAAYPMPANLALKIDVFLAGMLVAFAAFAPKRWVLFVAGAFLVLLPFVAFADKSKHYLAVQIVILAGFAGLVMHRRIAQALNVPVLVRAIGLLDNRVLRFAGDTSYGVYLLHLLIMIPLLGALTLVPDFAALRGSVRVALTTLLAAPPAYLVAYGLHVTLERQGIRLGKWWLASARNASALGSETVRPRLTEDPSVTPSVR